MSTRTAKQWLQQWFPEHCASCELATLDGAICRGCRRDWIVAEPVEASGKLAFVRAPYRYAGSLADLMPRMKFQRERVLARALGHALLDAVSRPPGNWALAPIPLHRSRLVERQFNQAREIAVPLAHSWRLPLRCALEKTRATPAQSTLSARQRQDNLRGAFRVRGVVTGHSILLIDDVMTTGSTLSAAAGALLRAGARQVAALVVARA